jgi:hypothetical protein
MIRAPVEPGSLSIRGLARFLLAITIGAVLGAALARHSDAEYAGLQRSGPPIGLRMPASPDCPQGMYDAARLRQLIDLH